MTNFDDRVSSAEIQFLLRERPERNIASSSARDIYSKRWQRPLNKQMIQATAIQYDGKILNQTNRYVLLGLVVNE